MATSRRAPDPASSFNLPQARRQLLAGLKADDKLVKGTNALRAAAEHLGRCKPKARTGAGALAVPEPAKRCCGKAQALVLLGAEAALHPAAQPLYRAVVEAKPKLDAIQHELAQPIEETLTALARQLGPSSLRRGPGSARPQSRTLTISRPSVNPPRHWLSLAIARFYTTATKAQPPGQTLHELVVLLEDVGVLFQALRGLVEERLLRQFPLPVVHEPVVGAGRPSDDLLRELSLLLRQTGHSVAEIAQLLPDGRGSIGASERVRARLQPSKQPSKQQRAKRASQAGAPKQPPRPRRR